MFTNDAKADVQSLDASIKRRLRKILGRRIAVQPEQYGTPLRGNLAGYWKHEFASHRVIYRIYPDDKLVIVCAVGARKGSQKKDVYRQLEVLARSGRLAERVLAVLKSLQSR
jgi:mRNA interferase RelE/StbE